MDGFYHLKGTLKGVANTTLSPFAMVVDFNDKSNSVTKTAGGPNKDSVNPGDLNFDLNTTYSKKQGNQFQYLHALIGDE